MTLRYRDSIVHISKKNMNDHHDQESSWEYTDSFLRKYTYSSMHMFLLLPMSLCELSDWSRLVSDQILISILNIVTLVPPTKSFEVCVSVVSIMIRSKLFFWQRRDWRKRMLRNVQERYSLFLKNFLSKRQNKSRPSRIRFLLAFPFFYDILAVS